MSTKVVSFGTEGWLKSPCLSCVNLKEDKGMCAYKCKNLSSFRKSLDSFLQANPGYCVSN